MSYASSAALQAAVYDALVTDATVSSLSNGAVYDALPQGALPGLYVSLGPERVAHRADMSEDGALHDFVVRVISDGAGFAEAKALAVGVSDALDDASLSLARGTLISLQFRRARARRTGAKREIDLWFRARIDLGSV